MNMEGYNIKKRLTREQKTGFVLLLVFTCLIMSLGVLQIRNNIFSPFVIRVTKTQYDEATLFQDDAVRLQSIDTDRDGLNDYEELSFYETSPYLPDTDSDGVDDKTEIEQGDDPLCPKGEDCSVSLEEKLLLSTSTDSVISSSNTAENPFDLLDGGVNQNITPEELVDSFQDVTKVREILKQTGLISPEELDKISDEDLTAILGQILTNQENINVSKTNGTEDEVVQ